MDVLKQLHKLFLNKNIHRWQMVQFGLEVLQLKSKGYKWLLMPLSPKGEYQYLMKCLF